MGARFTPDPNNSYTLQLDGSGGLSFSNSTAINLAPLTHLTFIQTDKKIYKAGQLGEQFEGGGGLICFLHVTPTQPRRS